MDIAIAGGSAAGLFAALLLARAGHHVVVLERDSLELAPDVESAAGAAFRPSAPQIVQPHIVMARCLRYGVKVCGGCSQPDGSRRT